MNATYAQLCRYHYDPLDRLATCSPAEQLGIQRFYQKNRLTTEIQGQIQRAFFQTEDQLLAQHQGPNTCTLLASDQQRSVLEGLDASQRQSASYTPYGARHPQANPLELLGFTGERADPVTGHYLLGNGYRAYNPVLMRFNSPDSLSPFGKGGLNAYAYCVGDPVNQVDPTGHTPMLVKVFLRALKIMKKPDRVATPLSKSTKIPGNVPTRLIQREKFNLPQSPNINNMSRQVQPNFSDIQKTAFKAEINNNKRILTELNQTIYRDNKAWGAITMNRDANPVIHDMILDHLTFKDNLLDKTTQLTMKLGNLPDYNFASGLPRYTDALENIRRS